MVRIDTVSKLKTNLHLLRRSAQLKFALAYVLLTTVLIVVLNIYPITVSKNVVFQAKQSSMLAKAEVLATSMGDLSELTEQSVNKALALSDDVGIDRIVITDSDGRCVYDSAASDNVLGQYVLFAELVSALNGNDVTRCVFRQTAFETFAAVPVMHHARPIGAVYVTEQDTQQADVIRSIKANIQSLSFAIGAAIIIMAVVFSLVFSRRIKTILTSIRTVRQGDYDHEIEIQSKDELGELAHEFNELTHRITATEQRRRQFVSDASHELKTPLASITLLADSILHTQDMEPDTMREFVQDIGNEAARLSRLAEKLLSLTRLDSRPEERLEPVDLAKTVEKVFRILRPLAQTRNVQLQSTMDNGCMVLAREDDIYQVIFNLAENGVKYNAPGGILQILLFRRGEQATLLVEDEGVGIPQQDRERIFERFYRVDKARSREAGGTGLGLAIVKDTVTKYGGSIEVSDRESRGTRFTVRFVLYEETADEEDRT